MPPDFDSGDFDYFVLAGGRGTGKSDAGAYAFDLYMQAHPGTRGRIVAPTLGDAREACVIGPSGVLAHNPLVHWNQNEGALYWPNGSRAKVFGAHHPEDVERLRAGGNSGLDWFEEFAAWAKLDEAFNQARFGLRLGTRPRTIVTTTPKTRPRFLWLIGQPQDGMPECPKIVLRHGTTADNPHLSEHVRRELYATYEGTRLGDQELRGLVIADLAGALWKRAILDELRVRQAHLPAFVRIVVGVDPSGGVAETGIVVAGLGTDHHGYILDDCSVGGSPNTWGVAVVDAYDKYQADRIIAEINQGGAMVSATIGTHAPNLPIRTVRAAKGKIARAEPVAALYEQGRCHHAGTFPRLEDQMTSWEAASGQASPDRLDAAVYALTDLMLGDAEWTPQGLVAAGGGRGYG